MTPPSSPTGHLQRELGLVALITYGVGDILGAGIYALVGKIAGVAAGASWLAFAIALAIVSFTALSYAELGGRWPRSGGESQFCLIAFRSPSVALFIGWLVLCSGAVSMATISHAFVGYTLNVTSIPESYGVRTALILLLLGAMGGINFWGIRQSSRANIICTLVEASGLLIVVVTGFAFLGANGGAEPDAPAAAAVAGEVWPSWVAISQGVALAFFAFIGFEDMVNVAEEVKNPRRNMPLAILAALGIAGVGYISVVWVACQVLHPAELASSEAPLLDVVRRAAPRFPPWIFAAIAVFAVANTALLNFITASRLLYGMAGQKLLPAILANVNPKTHTPHWAIATVFAATFALAMSGTLVHLAGTTSILLLLVFASVNIALVVIKRRDKIADHLFHIPIIVPVVGAVASFGLIGFLPQESLWTAATLIALGLLIVAVYLRRKLRDDSLSD